MKMAPSGKSAMKCSSKSNPTVLLIRSSTLARKYVWPKTYFC